VKIVLIDCSLAGASGDKMLSAFIDAGLNARAIEKSITTALRSAGIRGGGVTFNREESSGIRGLKLETRLEETAMGSGELGKAIKVAAQSLGLGTWGFGIAKKALGEIVGAEERVHGRADLHELGDADTLVDLVGTVKALELLGLRGAAFFVTPVAVGCGDVSSSHGALPVPAPATLEILKKYSFTITATDRIGELTTPTGAALLAALTRGARDPPPFGVEDVGVGIGSHRIGVPNITRVLIGRSAGDQEMIKVLETNLDDVSGETLGWLVERLQGQVEDISVMPMVTKKNRPGFMVRIVVKPDATSKVIRTLVRETGTLGVKIFDCQRYRETREVSSELVSIGKNSYPIRIKSSGNGRLKPEYDDLRRIASKEKMSLREVSEEVFLQVKQKYRNVGR